MTILIALFVPVAVAGGITFLIRRRRARVMGSDDTEGDAPPQMPPDLLQELSRDAWRSPGEHRVPPPGE